MLMFYDREDYGIDLEQQLTYCNNSTSLGGYVQTNSGKINVIMTLRGGGRGALENND